METESLTVSVVMQRIAIANRWQAHQWRPIALQTGAIGLGRTPYCLQADQADSRWCFPGFEVRLFSDEAEGYFLNSSAPAPCWFIMSRVEEHDGIVDMLVPHGVTLSYNEAARLMDGGERVDTLPLQATIGERLSSFVRAYYRPQENRKRKKPSFEGGAGVALMARAEGQHGR